MRILSVRQLVACLAALFLITAGLLSVAPAIERSLFAVRKIHSAAHQKQAIDALRTDAASTIVTLGPDGATTSPPHAPRETAPLSPREYWLLLSTLHSYVLPGARFNRSDHCPSLPFLNDEPRRAFNRPHADAGTELIHLAMAVCNLHLLLARDGRPLFMCYIPASPRQLAEEPLPMRFSEFCRWFSLSRARERFPMESSGHAPLSESHLRYVRETLAMLDGYAGEMNRLRDSIAATLGPSDGLYHTATVRMLEIAAFTLRRAIARGRTYSGTGRWFLLDVVEYVRGFVPLSMKHVLELLAAEMEMRPGTWMPPRDPEWKQSR